MAILRLAVESRKVQLVDIALDLIQKLIAHQHIQGPVFSISHRRETGGKAEKRRLTEDDEDLETAGADSSLPQVLPHPCLPGVLFYSLSASHLQQMHVKHAWCRMPHCRLAVP